MVVIELTPEQKAEFQEAMEKVYEKYSGFGTELIQKVLNCRE